MVTKKKIEKWKTEQGLLLLTCWSRDGLTLEQIAKKMGVSYVTLFNWKEKDEQIFEALSNGKEVADYQVENALFQRCIGMDISETKVIIKPRADGSLSTTEEKTIKHIMPDVTACLAWLNNRQSTKWKRNRDNIPTQEELDASKVTINVVNAGKDSKISANGESEEDKWEAEWNAADDDESWGDE